VLHEQFVLVPDNERGLVAVLVDLPYEVVNGQDRMGIEVDVAYSDRALVHIFAFVRVLRVVFAFAVGIVHIHRIRVALLAVRHEPPVGWGQGFDAAVQLGGESLAPC
jgi:uncharacterized protein (UPF0548 family)